jgi:hypothetical protein
LDNWNAPLNLFDWLALAIVIVGFAIWSVPESGALALFLAAQIAEFECWEGGYKLFIIVVAVGGAAFISARMAISAFFIILITFVPLLAYVPYETFGGRDLDYSAYSCSKSVDDGVKGTGFWRPR